MEEQEEYKAINNVFDKLVQSLEKDSMSQRDRGTLFELIVKTYLQNESIYKQKFDKVWMLNEVPEEYKIPKKDTGVDLVAKYAGTNELVAIQCKYYSKDTSIQKSHIDSFLNELGKNYYSQGIIVSSTDKWSKNADESLSHRNKDIIRIGLSQLRESEIDWSSFSPKNQGKVDIKPPKKPRIHQISAIEAVVEGFKTAERGKLIMAPGTGKTYTSMVIAEKMADEKNGPFRVLYLVPSIQLLSQSLRGWSIDSKFKNSMDTFAVCSDSKVTKSGSNTKLEDITSKDLGYPATTDYKKLLEYKHNIDNRKANNKFLVVFSTYQSIDVIIESQKNGFYEFDLVVCDEAHRTTGATDFSASDESSFVKVHSNDNIKASKRLYQTATPRIYGEDAKQKASDMSIVISDMNDSSIYGEEFYRIGFGDAIRKGILTDYKVMVLAVDEETVARNFQNMLANKSNSELEFDDVTKIIGCWNGLVKRSSNSNIISPNPMKRAIAFAGTIRESKKIENMFSQIVEQYLYNLGDTTNPMRIEIQHADGSMNALQKNEKISWLKSEVPKNTCRILTNARFLTEGVDIPDLDAVMFLKPRKSRIDIAQAVGRVMRKYEGKEYGYVILPIGIPAGKNAEDVLDNSDKYTVVWDILNALRSLDERFDSMINKLELNKKKPEQLQVIGVGSAPNDNDSGFILADTVHTQVSWLNRDEDEISDIERAIYGKIVKKVGNTRYWEDWSKDVADIAQQHMMRIRVMLEDTSSEPFKAFKNFILSLRHNINESITDDQAIEMLAQHLITKPIFEALFESYSFAQNNPISKSMDKVLKVLDEQGLMREQEKLQSFYDSVRIRAQGIDNLKAKQDIIIQLYDKFFKVGFKETTEKLGIVFTPIEVVDFIIHSVEDILNKHFGKSISDEGVHVIDPFTGTGTFIVRLLQSGLISKEDILRKYMYELHANEIVLLSYYIAAINIEETFHSILDKTYKSFDGIVLTDTFKMAEDKTSFDDGIFVENNERLKKQCDKPIFAIIGNPPYSVGKKSANDSSEVQSYPKLESSIEKTYGMSSKATLKKGLNDLYIKAFRWASDRISEKGVIGFVTNGSFIDSKVTDGLRKTWYEEFNYIYIFNLRGDQRTQGQTSRKEGGKIFGSGSRTPIAITLLVKDGSDEHHIFYNDIGDYLSREKKLEIISNTASIKNLEKKEIVPDINNDWINQRDKNYDTFIPLFEGIFHDKFIGVSTNRDNWVYGYSKQKTIEKLSFMVSNYNEELNRLKEIDNKELLIKKINNSSNFIKWSEGLKKKFVKKEKILLNNNIVKSMYRPFTKKWLYFDRQVIERPGQSYSSFNNINKVIYCTGAGVKRDFSCLVTDVIPNLHLMETGQGFFFNQEVDNDGLFINVSNITDSACKSFGLSDENLLYYIYGVLHSPEYRENFGSDLKKSLPKIPNLKNKESYVKIGQELCNLHLNYETFDIYEDAVIKGKNNPSYKVTKMKHPKKDELDKIVFNADLIITNIPERAYEYVVNGKPAIEWIIDQYQVKTDKNSGIVDNPNLYSDDERYIFDLLLRIINISVKTVDLIKSLPSFEVED